MAIPEGIKQEELLELAYAYSNYVMEYSEKQRFGEPVCIDEYYDHEWQQLQKRNNELQFYELHDALVKLWELEILDDKRFFIAQQVLENQFEIHEYSNKKTYD